MRVRSSSVHWPKRCSEWCWLAIEHRKNGHGFSIIYAQEALLCPKVGHVRFRSPWPICLLLLFFSFLFGYIGLLVWSYSLNLKDSIDPWAPCAYVWNKRCQQHSAECVCHLQSSSLIISAYLELPTVFYKSQLWMTDPLTTVEPTSPQTLQYKSCMCFLCLGCACITRGFCSPQTSIFCRKDESLIPICKTENWRPLLEENHFLFFFLFACQNYCTKQ